MSLKPIFMRIQDFLIKLRLDLPGQAGSSPFLYKNRVVGTGRLYEIWLDGVGRREKFLRKIER